MSLVSCGAYQFWVDEYDKDPYNLMPCQICGALAHMLDNADDESDTLHKFEQAECPHCGVRGPAALWDPAPMDRKGNITCTSREFVAFFTLQNSKHRPVAAERWNEMQAKIARGNLLEEVKPASSKRL